MNTNQRRLLITGLVLVVIFVFLKPIRYQNPFYTPVITSMSEFSEQAITADVNAPDAGKNFIAAGIVVIASLLGFYSLRDKHGDVVAN